MAYRLSAQKASREYSWSLVIVVILTIGLTTWITIPSIAYSMNNALSSYANGASTYVVISSNAVSAVSGIPGASPVFQVLPETTINQISQISGVQNVYPVIVNFSTIAIPNFYLNLTLVNENKTISNPNSTLDVVVESAVLGGTVGFPTELIQPISGQMPNQGEAAFMLNTGFGASIQNKYFQLDNNFTISVAGKNLTVTYVGQNEASPLFSSITVLWDQNFLKEQLGNATYNQTFGGSTGADYIIVKADSIADVSSVVSELQKMLANSGPSAATFQVIYDQAAIIDLQSIKSGTTSMYLLVGLFSLILAVALMSVVSYVGFKRRAWEVGLLLSQGWTWKGVYDYLLYYFAILSGLSTILSITLAYVLLSHEAYTFQVYGSKLVVVATPQTLFVLITIPIVLALSFILPKLTLAQIRKQGLDGVLREY